MNTRMAVVFVMLTLLIVSTAKSDPMEMPAFSNGTKALHKLPFRFVRAGTWNTMLQLWFPYEER